MTGETLLKHLADVARSHFALHVWQWRPQPVGTHAANSLHNQTFPDGIGKAFDAYRSAWRQARYVRWLKRSGHLAHVSEGIYNGRFTKLSVLDGQTVPSSVWGAAVWAEHRNHVHLAIR